MIAHWVFIILILLTGIGCSIGFSFGLELKKRGAIITTVISMVLAIAIACLLFWHLYYTESGKRAIKSFHSEVGGGLYRTVKVYDMQGEQIAEYKGKFDVEENQTDGVTKIKFDVGGERHIIYCSTGTVIIDEIERGDNHEDD